MSPILLFVVSFACMANGQDFAIPLFEDLTVCPQKTEWNATLNSYQVENCTDHRKPCSLFKGHDYSITIKFTPNEEVKEVSAVVKGIIAGMAIDYQVPQPDACEESGLKCPLQANQQVTYKTVLPVKTIYPSISLSVRWALLDEQKRTLICIMIPVRVKNAPAN